MAVQPSVGHSSAVRMTLRIGGEELAVAQMGPDFLILKESAASVIREGIVVLVVDGISEEIPVRLPSGISADSRRVEIAEIKGAAELAAA